MIRVGITGGIGSGKTTFCKTWEELGAFVVYADDFAKDLMITDQLIIQQIKETFGKESYFGNGGLNRAYLAEEAFAKNRVEELNAIVHPRLWERMEELALQKEMEGVHVFAKEAAILLKDGRPENLDVVIILLAEDERRVRRVMERDETDEQHVLDRVQKQPEFEELAHLADFLVMNYGTKEELKAKAKAIFRKSSNKHVRFQLVFWSVLKSVFFTLENNSGVEVSIS